MTKSQKEIAERVAELLVQSPLNDTLKDLIIDKIDTLPENMVSDLLNTLETENDRLEEIATKIGQYIDSQEAGWESVEEEQKSYSDKYLEDMAQTLDDEARIQELKESI